MSRPRLLDLFCCAGGAAMGYHRHASPPCQDYSKALRHVAAPTAAAMGVDWMVGNEIGEAIPPVYTELIGRQLLQHLGRP